MKAIPLTAEVRREVGKRTQNLRKQGLIPATVYGREVKSVSLSMPVKDFMKVYGQAGETGLVDLKYGSTSQPTLISDVQFHPLTRLPLHVQFHAVKLTEKLKANVPLELVGESPAVVNNIGILLQTLNGVEVEALPTDLPEKIEIDVTTLSEVGQQISVGDLKIPSGVELLTLKEEIVVKVASAISEEAKKEAEKLAAEEAAKAAEAVVTPETTTPEAPKEEKS